MGDRSAKKLLIGIVMLALAARFAVAMLTTSWVFPSNDNFWTFGYEMGQIASSLATGNGFSWPDKRGYLPTPTAWMPPAYPLIMAAAFKVFGIFSEQAAIAIEILLTITSILSCILIYLLGKHLYDIRVGLLAAFLLAIYPPSIHYAVRNLWDTSLFTCCLLLTILLFLKLASHPGVKQGAYLGIVLGFTALVNPIIVATYPFAFAWIYLKAETDRRTIIKTMSSMLIVYGLVISPWFVRNYVVFGQFAFIKSNFGNELYLGTKGDTIWGNKEGISGGGDVKSAFTETEQEFLKQANEVMRNGFLLRKAIAFIVEHPIRFTEQTLIRFSRFWTFMRLEQQWTAQISLAIYLMLLILAASGLLLSRAKGQDVRLVLLFLLSLPLPYYFTVVHIFRYRYPIEPLLMIFASYTVYWLIFHSVSREGSAGFLRKSS
jgi:4-amino-4-deoxy-L-arabinose transferase-like glycosyltransferase